MISRVFLTCKKVSSVCCNSTFSTQHQTGQEEKTANPLGEYRIEVAHVRDTLSVAEIFLFYYNRDNRDNDGNV